MRCVQEDNMIGVLENFAKQLLPFIRVNECLIWLAFSLEGYNIKGFEDLHTLLVIIPPTPCPINARGFCFCFVLAFQSVGEFWWLTLTLASFNAAQSASA
jgi:hypothetical protein